MSNVEKFDGSISNVNKSTFRRGKVVPNDAVNLAWIKTPELNPANNMIIVDTSSAIAENVDNYNSGIYFANLLGKLEDENGTKLISEKYPAISDEFKIEGDISNIDLSTEYAFPYVHVSRFFHVDKIGLTSGPILAEYNSSLIKVVDSSGNIYADQNGKPKFIIKIIPTYQSWPGVISDSRDSAANNITAYRVHAFVDDNTIEGLYLKYDKIEIANDGKDSLVNQVINYKETLNPQPCFEFRPEESEVFDPINSDQKWYSTIPISLKDKVLGLPVHSGSGYEVMVPKKAIPDPRLFQMFDWRVVCTLTQNYKVSTDSTKAINCGVVVTNSSPTSNVAQMFNVIVQQPINTLDLTFANPLNAGNNSISKAEDNYWYVNFDTIAKDDLSKFDLLIWAPETSSFDFSNYNGLIQYFTNTLGNTLLVDTDSYTVPKGLGINTTPATIIETGSPVNGISIGANYAIPSNSNPPADLSTWMPQLFLGMLENVTNFNPPPPIFVGKLSPKEKIHAWTKGSPSALLTKSSSFYYIQYIASDGNAYWKRNTGFNAFASLASNPAKTPVSPLATTNSLTAEQIVNWNPPIFAGVTSKAANLAPPIGLNNEVSQWQLGQNPPMGDYLQYQDNLGQSRYLSISVASGSTNDSVNSIINSYALVNPAISFSGDIEIIVKGIQSWFPGSYPDITTGTVKNIGTNVKAGGVYTKSLAIGTSSTSTGALYNYPSSIQTQTASQAANPASSGSNMPFSGTVAIDSTDNGATYNEGSSFFDAEALNGWKIDTSEPISYFQSSYGVSGGKVQYLLDLPSNTNTLASGQLATLTTELIDNPLTTHVTNYTDTKEVVTIHDTLTSTHVTYGYLIDFSNSMPEGVSFADIIVSEIIITVNAPYTNLINDPNPSGANGISCYVSAPSNLIGHGLTASTTDLNGVLRLNASLHNGSPLDLTNSISVLFSTGSADLDQLASIKVALIYYTPTESTVTTPYNGIFPQSAIIPFLSPVPVMVERGKSLISTLGIPQSVCYGITGAAKLLYNIALVATSNKSLNNYSEKSYTSSIRLSSNWQSSWVINITDNPRILSDYEKGLYGFSYLSNNYDTPEIVGQRRLSDLTCQQLIIKDIASTIGNPGDPVLQNEKTLLEALAGADKTYTIEITNSLVNMNNQLHGVDPDSIPFAWTRAYTPELKVPPGIGTYIVRESTVKGNNVPGTYLNKSYPEEPYIAQVKSYVDSSNTGSIDVNWLASGMGSITYNIKTWHPPVEVQQLISKTTSVEVLLDGKNNGLLGQNYVENHLPYNGVSVPGTIQTLQDDNYYTFAGSCWPFMGYTGLYAQNIPISSTGCKFIQDALNLFHNNGYFTEPSGNIAVDGQYGPKTAAAVFAFQSANSAQSSQPGHGPGVVDAETLSIIGTQVLRSGVSHSEITDPSDYKIAYQFPWNTIRYENVSDGDVNTKWCKRSNAYNGPGWIWDVVSISFNDQYNMHGVTITPWCEGTSSSIVIAGIDPHISTDAHGLIGPYNPNNMMLKNLGIRGTDNQPVYIPFSSTNANQIYIWIGQDTASYSNMNIGAHNVYDIHGNFYCSTAGAERTQSFGIRNITVSATVEKEVSAWQTVTIPGYTTTDTVTADLAIEASGTASVSLGQDYTANIYPDISKYGSGFNINIDNVFWETVETDQDPNMYSGISTTGSMWISFTHLDATSLTNSTTISGDIYYGPSLPITLYNQGDFAPESYSLLDPVYWKSPVTGTISPMPEVGHISKTDGIKLLCNTSGFPVGFPDVPLSTTLVQRHYVNMAVCKYWTSSDIQVGFYDIVAQEFIVDSNGLSQMTYGDYTKRGKNNVFVGVLSLFEKDTQMPLSNADDAPMLPNAMIMPAYGVNTSQKTNIKLGTLPPNLGQNSVWPIPVQTGSFTRPIQIPPVNSGILTHYLATYQGRTLTAYYSIPEAQDQGWSPIYGYPNMDIDKESPLIVDQSTIRVRQPSILMQRQPTIYNTFADPVRPIFTVYTRASVNSSFVALPWSEIKDYRVADGTIYLNHRLSSNDPNLVAVDYTSTKDSYLFREYNGSIINLNPFSSGSFNNDNPFVENPVYVYIVPNYVLDQDGNTISNSYQSRTLRYAFDSGIFNQLDPSYDPTAIQLGVIYISTNFDLNDLVVLDTRKLGGGGSDTISDASLIASNHDAVNYWDVSYGTGMSYQNGSYVIVRLPAALKGSFTDQEINDIIRKNLSAGVQFSIEDSEGNSW